MMKRCSFLTAVMMMLLMTSCVSYRYFPVHQHYYNFDSANDFNVALGLECVPFTLGSVTGAELTLAYSPVKHLAMFADGYARVSTGQQRRDHSGLNANRMDLSSSSSAIGGGGGLIFYTRWTPKTSFDFSAGYDFQLVDYYYSVADYKTTTFHTYDFEQPLHTLTALPSLRHPISGNSSFNYGVGTSVVLTSPDHYYPNAPRIGSFAADVLIQPGVACVTPFGSCTVNLNLSAYHPDKARVLTVVGKDSPYDIHYFPLYNMTLRLGFGNKMVEDIRRKAEVKSDAKKRWVNPR